MTGGVTQMGAPLPPLTASPVAILLPPQGSRPAGGRQRQDLVILAARGQIVAGGLLRGERRRGAV